MKEYEVWMEGYAATGESDKHRLVGRYEADTFQEACKQAAWDLANGKDLLFENIQWSPFRLEE